MSTRRSEAVGVTQHKAKPDAALLPLFCTTSLGTHVRVDTYRERTRVLIDNVTRLLYSCYIYGSVSAGREKWPFNVILFLKVEPPCDKT